MVEAKSDSSDNGNAPGQKVPPLTIASVAKQGLHPGFAEKVKRKLRAKQLEGYNEDDNEGEELWDEPGDINWLNQFKPKTRSYNSHLPPLQSTANASNPNDTRRIGIVAQAGQDLWTQVLKESQKKTVEDLEWSRRKRRYHDQPFTKKFAEAIRAAKDANSALLELVKRQAVESNTEVCKGLSQLSILGKRIYTLVYSLQAPLKEELALTKKELKGLSEKIVETGGGGTVEEVIQLQARVDAVKELARGNKQACLARINEKLQQKRRFIQDFVRKGFEDLLKSLEGRFVSK